MNNTRSLQDYCDLFEQYLPEKVPMCTEKDADMRPMLLYSLEGGGKRVRPVLCQAFCELCGGQAENALDFACAIEFVHTYSLIHDDLPCMDNDDLRRGKPTSHKRFGEANALLTGDALLTHSFGCIADAWKSGKVSAEAAVCAGSVLAECAGVNGMIGGQYVDLKNEGQSVGIKELTWMDRCKTGALMQAACQLGCIAANAGDRQINAAAGFAEALGLAFQIVDDLLDAAEEESGDIINQKATYPSVLGMEKAKELARSYTEKAVDALEIFGSAAGFLRDYAFSLANRTK